MPLFVFLCGLSLAFPFRGPVQSRHHVLQPQNGLNEIPVPQRIVQQFRAAVQLSGGKRFLSRRGFQQRIQQLSLPDQRFPADDIPMFREEAPQDFRAAHGLEQKCMAAIRRPGGGLQNGGDILPAQARNGDHVRLMGPDAAQTVAQAEADALHAVEAGVFPGPPERFRAQIAGKAAAHAPVRGQPEREIAVIGSHVRERRALGNPLRQRAQPGREGKRFHSSTRLASSLMSSSSLSTSMP